ncbi:MAG: rane protein patially similar to glycosyltransferase, partial [Myxococcales bacterium]|nr:rane protein patially similar to glycosyltransferase [Myxococcales bacterium]
HNAAVAAGDAGAAVRWRAALLARLDLPVRAKFDNRTELLGAIRSRGAQRGFTYEFVSGTFKTDCKLIVRDAVVAGPVLSTLPRDTVELDLGSPPTWPTSLWKPGWIYSYRVVLRQRPGTEQLLGSWLGDVHRTDGPPQIDLGRF